MLRSDVKRLNCICGEVQPTCLTFVMRWCISLVSNNLAFGEAISFITTYRYDAYEWSARIYRDFTTGHIGEYSVELIVEPVRIVGRQHPIAEYCKFSLQISDDPLRESIPLDGMHECVGDSARVEVYATKDAERTNHKVVYRAPHETKFANKLDEVFRSRSLAGNRDHNLLDCADAENRIFWRYLPEIFRNSSHK
ncbi:unnamed protein product [Toxocara canis]|uniref:Protein AF-9 homolog n=1 Tax=Toxocara canis TaxID=6265 RepID=A0A183UZ99_TOXCA|nr:unnamed protein product [Toxocara canis]